MDDNRFFKWASRINSLLLLALLIFVIGYFGLTSIQSSRFRNQHEVNATVVDSGETEDALRLTEIRHVCGRDIQYVELSSAPSKMGLSSGGYGGATRNVLFFVGDEMKSHWLYDSNKYLISKLNELQKSGSACEHKETTAFYYEVYKEDTNKDGHIDNRDRVTAVITQPDGLGYKEIENGVDSIIDSSANSDATMLTLLVQQKDTLFMKRFSLQDGHQISETEITKMSKH